MTMTANLDESDIDFLLSKLAQLYPAYLAENNMTVADVKRNFGLDFAP